MGRRAVTVFHKKTDVDVIPIQKHRPPVFCVISLGGDGNLGHMKFPPPLSINVLPAPFKALWVYLYTNI